MPRLKAPSFVKALGGRQSTGYDGLESDAPLATAGATSPDKENAPSSLAGQRKQKQQQESEQKQVAIDDGTEAAFSSQAKASKPKKPWKGIGSKLRMGRSKISTWEEIESEMLQSPVTSPTAVEGKSLVGPSAAAMAAVEAASALDDRRRSQAATPSSMTTRGDAQQQQQQQQQQQVGTKWHRELTNASLFAAHRGAEQQQGGSASGEQYSGAGAHLPGGKGDECDNRVHAIGSTSSSDCEPENDDTFASNAATAIANDGSAGRKTSFSKVTGEPKTQPQPDGASSTKGRKLKLRLNLKSSLKRISSDLSRALKRSDGLNAQVTLVTPPAAAGDSHTATPPSMPVAVKVATFKNVGGSISRDVEQQVQVNHHGAGYNALNASYNDEENSSDEDGADDVDEVSQPHVVSRLTLSAHAPLRDGGFKPL